MAKRKTYIRTNNDLRKHYTVNERSSNTFPTTTEVELGEQSTLHYFKP